MGEGPPLPLPRWRCNSWVICTWKICCKVRKSFQYSSPIKLNKNQSNTRGWGGGGHHLAVKLPDGPFGAGARGVGHESAALGPEQLDVGDVAAAVEELQQVLLSHLLVHVAHKDGVVVGVQVAGVECACIAVSGGDQTKRRSGEGLACLTALMAASQRNAVTQSRQTQQYQAKLHCARKFITMYSVHCHAALIVTGTFLMTRLSCGGHTLQPWPVKWICIQQTSKEAGIWGGGGAPTDLYFLRVASLTLMALPPIMWPSMCLSAWSLSPTEVNRTNPYPLFFPVKRSVITWARECKITRGTRQD